MRRVALIFAAFLFFAPLAHADKLAPPQNTLQPLPQNVQPAVSESVQRTASPQDIQTVQNAQASEPAPDSNVAPGGAPSAIELAGSGPSFNATLFLIAAAILVLLGGAAVWLWRSF